jgi:hypothetical protein
MRSCKTEIDFYPANEDQSLAARSSRVNSRCRLYYQQLNTFLGGSALFINGVFLEIDDELDGLARKRVDLAQERLEVRVDEGLTSRIRDVVIPRSMNRDCRCWGCHV